MSGFSNDYGVSDETFCGGTPDDLPLPAPNYITEERLGWLDCLIASYKQEHDWGDDEDQSATYEMLYEVESLVKQLRPHARREPDVPRANPVDDSTIPF